ncbi:acyltransferase [Rhodobacteraceae bacterium R_SAG2]|nr:acyltransferase [Rhodobacteraceae bacterium R_SAG2]
MVLKFGLSYINPAKGQFGEFSLSSQQINVLKGMLIALVVLFHVPSKNALFLDVRAGAYNFHAVGFLVLSLGYSLPTRPLWGLLLSRFLRYYVPMLWFSGLAGILSLTAIHLQIDLPNMVQPNLSLFMKAILLGTAPVIDEAIGFQLYWFLPALFGLFLYRLFCLAVPFYSIHAILLIISFVLFLIMGQFSREFLANIPIFLTISLYSVFLSVSVFAVVRPMLTKTGMYADVLIAVVWIGLMAFLVETERRYNIAVYDVPTFYDPVGLVSYILVIALGLRSGISVASIPFVSSVLAFVGRYSLEIYLGHIIVIGGLVAVLQSSLKLHHDLWHVTVVGILAIAISLGISVLLRKCHWVARILFPSGGTSSQRRRLGAK